MNITFNRDAYQKVFNDLDEFRDYCRFEGKVFDEKSLYKKSDPVWQAYQKYQNSYVQKHVVVNLGDANA